MLRTTEPLQRLAYAEILRKRMIWADNDPALARSVRRVVGWQPEDRVRWPGTGCTWTEHYVLLFWEDWDGEPQVYEWPGNYDQLLAAAEELLSS